VVYLRGKNLKIPAVGRAMPIDPRLLEILACPVCKVKVVATPTGDGLKCDRCLRTYPIREGIPIMLVEEARQEGDPST
jgi:uncharacterized protein YbaR (Trm112 family)